MDFRSLYKLNLQFVNAGGKFKYLLRLPSLNKTTALLKKNKELITNRKSNSRTYNITKCRHNLCYVYFLRTYIIAIIHRNK